MQIRTSYYYQIRHFKPNFIPISTTITDPLYFHNFTGDYSYIFKDKRGIVNGIRALPIIECGKAASGCHGLEECIDVGKENCSFLTTYQQNLQQMNFNQLIKDFQRLADNYQKKEHIHNEIVIVLMVYEAPKNPCSERQSLINYFNSNGISCKELTYPIV